MCVPRFQFFLYYVCDGFHTWWNWFAMLLFPGKQHIRTFVSRRLSQDYQDIGACYHINRPCSLFPVSPQQFICFCRWVCERVHALIAFLWSSLTGKEENIRSWCIQNQSIGVWTATENCYEQWWWQRVMWQPLPNHGKYNNRSVGILKMPTATDKPCTKCINGGLIIILLY